MLWPRLSPERSCVCCRSRRRLGRLRARPASQCNLDRVVFRYQNERRSRLARLRASSETFYLGHRTTAKRRIARIPLAETNGKCPPNCDVHSRGRRWLVNVDSSRPECARSGRSASAERMGSIRPFAAVRGRSSTRRERQEHAFPNQVANAPVDPLLSFKIACERTRRKQPVLG